MCISDIYIILCQSTANICTNNIIQSSEISEKPHVETSFLPPTSPQVKTVIFKKYLQFLAI